ncbi:hypothetical protein ES689_09690 [Frigoribacterium sp. ACAM 257]|uniref:hypothetical protein n=1 Tax=Frigoribacterium sp. ACAM 257 TaxID=2508998 RepID=UPI0011B98AEA|nr:hypothetical protein [Frigoribacterium sp. ACAM 257]TWX38860.1 hypothetical protein ES689_09690 [Frigoribacterium sp. ACAM 257]
MSKRGLSLFKAVIAFIGALVIAVFVVPQMMTIIGQPTIDQGTRPLVMVTTTGGNRDYQLRVRNYVDDHGEYSFVLSIVDDDVTYDSGGNAFEVDVQITMAHLASSPGMSCGPESGVASTVETASLNAGARRMLAVDANSGSRSSTLQATGGDDLDPAAGGGAPAPSGQAPNLEALYDDFVFDRYTTQMSLLDDSYVYDTASESNGFTWAVECRIDNALVWRTTDAAEPVEQAQATFFAPEFDFGPQGTTSDYQRDMDITMSLARADGLDLVRSYPESEVGARDWRTTYSNQWNGELGQEGNFGYATGPTFILANRDAVKEDQNFLLFGGVLLGLALTLFIRGLSDLADGTLLREDG